MNYSYSKEKGSGFPFFTVIVGGIAVFILFYIGTREPEEFSAQVVNSSDVGSYTYRGDEKIKEDIRPIAQASFLYKKDSEQGNILLPNIRHGCKVVRARYRNTSSPSPTVKRLFLKIDSVCDEYI
jgi:hypothetical protein